MKNGLTAQVVVPIAVVVISGLIAAYMIGSRPEARPNPPSQIVRAVTIVTARQVTVRPEIRVFGEIASGREAEIRSMVAGRLIYLGPGFRAGAYVEAGSQLAAIDPFEYEIVLREQQADLAEAQARSRELQSDLGAERQLLKLLDEQI